MEQPKINNKKDYASNVYNALKDNLSGFDKTEEQFKNEIKNPEYAKKVHKALSDNLSGFNKSEDEFIGLVSKKKDLSEPKQNVASTSEAGSSGLPKFNVNDYAKKTSVKKEENQIVKENTATAPISRREVSIDQAKADNKTAEPFIKKQKQLINEELSNFRNETSLPTDYVDQATQEVNDEVNKKGFVNGLQTGLKKAVNTIAEPTQVGFNALKSLFTDNVEIQPKPLFDLDPISKEKEEAKKMLLDSKVKPEQITPELLEKTAVDLKIKKKVDDKKLSLVNDYLDSLDDDKKELLELDAYDKIKKTKPIVDQKFKEIKSIDIELQQDNEQLKILEQKYTSGNFTEEDAATFESISNNLKQKIELRSKKYNEFVNDTENLGTIEEEYDLFKRDYGFSDKASKLLNTVADFGLGALQFANMNLSTGPQREVIASKIAEVKANKDKTVETKQQKSVESVQNINDAVDYFADVMITQAPNLALGYFSGGTSMLAGIGVTSAGNQYSELTTSNMEGKTDYTESQKIASSVITGGAEMIESNTLRMLGGSKRLLNSIIKNEPTRELFKKSLSQKTFDFGKEFLKNYAGEAKEELTTYAVEKLSDVVVLDMEAKDVFKNAPDEIKSILKDTAVMTVGLNVAPATVAKVAKVFTPKNYVNSLDKNNVKITELNNIINNENVSEEVKSQSVKLLGETVKANENILKDVIGKASKLEEPFIDKVIELEQKSSEIRTNAQKIYEDLSISKDQREMLLSDLESKYKENEATREKIVSGNSTVFDILPGEKVDSLKKQAVKQLVSEKEGSNEANFTNEVINEKAVEIYNKSNNGQIKEVNEINTSNEVKAEIPNSNQIKNETAPSENIVADGNIQSGTSVVEQNGITEQEDTATENIPKTANIRASESNAEIKPIFTKKITSTKVRNPKTKKFAEFDVDIQDGEIVSIRNPKNGKEIEKFIEYTYKTKDKDTGKEITKKGVKKNANWSSIESQVLGIETDNEINKRNKEILSNFVPSNEYEAALHALATGSKVSLESIKKESSGDGTWATNQSSKEELPSVEKLSELIWNDNENLDQEEVRNQLIDVIDSFKTIKEAQQAITEIYGENKSKLEEQEARAYLNQLSESDLAMYEAIKAEDAYLDELTDKDLEKYYNQKIDEYEQGEQATAGKKANERGSDFVESNETTQRESATKNQKVKIIFGPFSEFGGEGVLLENGNVELDDGEIINKSNIDSIENIEDDTKQNKNLDTEQASEQDRSSKLITERIKPVKRKPKNSPKKLPQIIKDAANGLKATLIYGKSSRTRSLGTYNPSNALTRITRAGDIDTVSHELGHLLDDRFNIVGTIQSNNLIDAMQELNWFSERGGSNPPSGLTPAKKKAYLEREGLAEFIRAYIVNPKQAEIIAPNIYGHFNDVISEDNLAVIKQLSDDYLDYANASYGEQIISNVEDSSLPNKNGFREWMNRFKKEDGRFSVTPFDSLNSHLFASMTNAYRAFEFLTEKSGEKDLLPEKNFEILSRLFAGINGKTNRVLSGGMIDGKNNVITDSQGNKMTINWLLDPLDSSSEKTLREDMDETIKLLVSERTVEYAKKFGRLDNLTGIGAGVNNDIDVAQGFIDDFESLKTTNKEKYNRIKDAAKRYRDYADAGLKYAVDKGRISKESYQEIKQSNQYYVSLARVNENAPMEEEVPFFNEMAGGIASVKDIIKKAKGGTKFIQNPYLSLVQNTVNIIKESDRNETLRSFIDPINKIREMGDGTPTDFSQIARPAKTGDKNSKTIYIDGVAQKWQFSQDVYTAITSMESLSDNALVNMLTLPANIIRFTVTNFPTFALRNAVRDLQSRLIISRSNSGFKDLVHSATDKELYELYGGSQAGYYLVNKDAYKQRLNETIKEVTAKGGIVLDPKYIWHGYKKLLEKGESINRIAEFKSSFRKAKKEGLDDYNASLYAAYQSRDLMDFAVAGHTIRTLNKFIPFLNAGIQGLVRTRKSVKEDPTGFAFRTAIYTVLPTVAIRILISYLGDDDEYEELPAHQRDLFYNFKTPATGDVWISIPKPFEQGMIASATDRIISKSKGYETAFEGFSGSLAKTLTPVDESSILGGLKPLFEVSTNRNMFTDRPIISPFEEGKLLELRKGTENASRVSKTLQKGFKEVGWEVDPRNIDHIIKGYGTYIADWGLSFGDLGVDKSRFKFGPNKTGFAKDVPMNNSVSVNSVYKLATELGKWQDRRVKLLRDEIELFYDEEDVAKRKEMSKKIFSLAKDIKKEFQEEKKKLVSE